VDKLTYSIDQIARMGALGRSKIYAEIAAGRLKARKAGRRTVILAEDYRAYLEALPAMTGKTAGINPPSRPQIAASNC
jgi:excisionase family DNA binding protein